MRGSIPYPTVRWSRFCSAAGVARIPRLLVPVLLVPGLLRWGLLLPILLLGGSGCSRSEPAAAEPQVKTTAPAVSAALETAERLVLSDRLDEALIVAEQLVRQAPEDWRAHEMNGRVLAAMALRESRRAARPSASAPGEAREPAADRVIALQEQSAVRYDRATELGPQLGAEASQLRQAAGMAADQLGDMDRAAVHYEAAATLDPDNPQPPLFLAQIRLRQDRLDDARIALDAVLALRPDEAMALAGLAEIARREGRLDEALERIRAARRLVPESIAVRHAEARLLRLAGRPREGLELMLAAGEAVWSAPSFVEEVALSWRAIGQPDRAAQALELAHRREPARWQLGLLAAEAWLDAGDRVRADLVLRDIELVEGGRREVGEMRERVERRE